MIQNTERQPLEVTRRPPSTGPSAIETPTTAPHTPTACARSRGSVKVLVMIDIATGLSIEPPTACIIRNAISMPNEPATLQSSEPAEKIARPVMNVRRRPNLSAVEPERSRSEASTSV